MVLRTAFLVWVHQIPKCCVVNADHTGIMFVQAKVGWCNLIPVLIAPPVLKAPNDTLSSSFILHPGFTTVSPQSHPNFTPCSPHVHPMFTPASPQLHPSFTQASPQLHPSFTTATQQLHPSFTSGSLQLHASFTPASRQVHPRFTAWIPFQLAPLRQGLFLFHKSGGQKHTGVRLRSFPGLATRSTFSSA